MNICLVLVGQVIGTWPTFEGDLTHRCLQLMRGAITSPVIKLGFAKASSWQFSAIADVDGDGQMEVVVGSYDKKVYCLSGTNGFQEWAFTTAGAMVSSPPIADVDGDGQMEVVVGSYDKKVYCLSGTNGFQEWAFTTAGAVVSSPAIADVDGDGQMEVVVGSYDSTVYCLRGSNGSQKWSFKTTGYVQSSASIADIDGDGVVEVLIGSWNNNIYCLRGTDGFQKWSYPTGGYVHLPGTLVDIDGDGKLEYLASQNTTSTLYCLNSEDGSVAWQIGIGYDVHTPFAGDIDKDGCAEVVVGTRSPYQGSRVFVIDDPGNAQGCGPVYEDVEEGLGKGFEFSTKGQSIYLFMPQSTQVSLTIYDAQGRLAQRLYDGVLSQGAHAFIPMLETDGVYLVVLRYQEGMEIAKMIR